MKENDMLLEEIWKDCAVAGIAEGKDGLYWLAFHKGHAYLITPDNRVVPSGSSKKMATTLLEEKTEYHVQLSDEELSVFASGAKSPDIGNSFRSQSDPPKEKAQETNKKPRHHLPKRNKDDKLGRPQFTGGFVGKGYYAKEEAPPLNYEENI